MTWIERTTATLAEVVFPPVCAGCGRLGAVLCSTCVSQLALVEDDVCLHCGRILVREQRRVGSCCTACAAEPPLPHQVRAPYLYVEPASHLIHRLKYDGFFALAKPLAALMVIHWPQWDEPPDLIVPIPLHKRRQRRRGFNQSALLAKGVSEGVGIASDERALQRHRHTRPQIDLGPEARYENVAGAFSADAQRVSDRHVLLIDDVYTTGATMAAATAALQAAGASSVSGYCLARVS